VSHPQCTARSQHRLTSSAPHLCRHINDHRDGAKINAKFVKLGRRAALAAAAEELAAATPEGGGAGGSGGGGAGVWARPHARVVALRPIGPGEEIHCAYGEVFWRDRPEGKKQEDSSE